MATIAMSPLVVIVGETASGKSALAIELAKKFNGEIICADSRTVYVGMDIGTAKPTRQEQEYVRHHLLNVTTPNDLFTAADFKAQAQTAIDDITARGKLPIMVGGTGLYIDSILYDFQFRSAAVGSLRTLLNTLSVSELKIRIQEAGLELPTNQDNPRHLIRTLETNGAMPKQQTLRLNTLIVGLSVEKALLHARIENRVATMMRRGLDREAQALFEQYGQECRALQTIGYQEFVPYFTNDITLHEVQDKIIVGTRQYAKRQRTWFKRNKSIHWCSEQIQIVDLVTTFLNK